MTVRRKKSFATNWYFKNAAYALYPTYGRLRGVRARRRLTVAKENGALTAADHHSSPSSTSSPPTAGLRAQQHQRTLELPQSRQLGHGYEPPQQQRSFSSLDSMVVPSSATATFDLLSPAVAAATTSLARRKTATTTGKGDGGGGRVSRLAIVFAILFVIALVLAAACIVAFALLTDGFVNFTGHRSCLSSNNSTRGGRPSKPGILLGGSGGDRSTYQSSGNGSERVCLTPDCIRIAAHYLNNMDASVEPCRDFYGWACGRWAASRTVPQHENKLTVLSEMRGRLDTTLREILERQPADNQTGSSDCLRLAQIHYEACLDQKAQSDLDSLPLTSLISALGGWPLLTNARFDESAPKWEQLGGHLSLYGIPSLFRVFVHNHFIDNSHRVLMFGPPRLLLDKRKFYREGMDGRAVKLYRTYMLDLLELLGAEREIAELAADSVLRLEIAIANMTRTEYQRNHSALHNPSTWGEMQQRYSKIRWEQWVNPELRTWLGSLNDSTPVNILDPDYFQALQSMIATNLDAQTVHDYLMWRLVSSLDAYLPALYRVPYQTFKEKLVGASQRPVWESCVHEVRSQLADPLATAYATQHFSTEARDKALETLSDLRAAMESTLLNAEWMDELTRQAALRKLAAMRHKIGFGDRLLNETLVLTPYAGVRLAADRYFDNAILLKKTAMREHLMQLHRKQDPDEWRSPVITVDAFHFFNGNEIVFPAGILQYPMFVESAPSYVNYGAVGMGIGHEITHGYDDLGSQYDADGNLRGWWAPETQKVFQSKKQCFVAQYGAKTEATSKRKLDGRLTIGENIADNGGLRIAHHAWRRRVAREPDQMSLPGLQNFTDSQLFFVAFANTWCEAVRPAAIDYILDTDVHSLGRFRVNVPLQNLPAFSQAFSCPIGSQMNPFEKCRIW